MVAAEIDLFEWPERNRVAVFGVIMKAAGIVSEKPRVD
jgi:hypothetical protein